MVANLLRKQNNPPKIRNSHMLLQMFFYEYRSLIYDISGRIYINLFTKSGSKYIPFLFCNNLTASTTDLAFFIRANGSQNIERITHRNDSSFNKDFLSLSPFGYPVRSYFYGVYWSGQGGSIPKRGLQYEVFARNKKFSFKGIFKTW
jgi:hypothetical protein